MSDNLYIMDSLYLRIQQFSERIINSTYEEYIQYLKLCFNNINIFDIKFIKSNFNLMQKFWVEFFDILYFESKGAFIIVPNIIKGNLLLLEHNFERKRLLIVQEISKEEKKAVVVSLKYVSNNLMLQYNSNKNELTKIYNSKNSVKYFELQTLYLDISGFINDPIFFFSINNYYNINENSSSFFNIKNIFSFQMTNEIDYKKIQENNKNNFLFEQFKNSNLFYINNIIDQPNYNNYESWDILKKKVLEILGNEFSFFKKIYISEKTLIKLIFISYNLLK